jgi:hypothetical protein
MSLVGGVFLIQGSLLMLGGALDERLHRLERELRYLPREYSGAHHRPEHGAPHDPASAPVGRMLVPLERVVAITRSHAEGGDTARGHFDPQAGAAAGRLLLAVRANLDKHGVPAQARYDSQSESDGGTDVRFEVWCHLTNLAVDQPADPTV